MYAPRCLVLFYISTKYHKIIPKGLKPTERTRNQWIITVRLTKGDNAKSKKDRVVILVRDMSSGSTFLPNIIKMFYRVSDLQNGHEINGLSLSNITKGDNAKSKKGRAVILVRDMSSGPVLHFYQVS